MKRRKPWSFLATQVTFVLVAIGGAAALIVNEDASKVGVAMCIVVPLLFETRAAPPAGLGAGWYWGVRPRPRAGKKKPDIRVVVRHETWLQIAQGKLSPFEAFITAGLFYLVLTVGLVRLFKYAELRWLAQEIGPVGVQVLRAVKDSLVTKCPSKFTEDATKRST